MVKLDLLNSRLELPKSHHVYDSIEDANLAISSLSTSCTVKIGTKQTKSRKIKLNSIKVPDRSELLNITNNGDYIDITKRKGSLVNYGQKPSTPAATTPSTFDGEQHTVFSGSTTMSHRLFVGPGTMDISDFKHLVHQAAATAGQSVREKEPKIHAPVLDFIKDRVHDDFSHTIEYQVKKKQIPAPNIAHSRPTAIPVPLTAAEIERLTPGPGAYTPVDVSIPHPPQILINPPRLVMDESRGEIVPLKERLRRERQQQSMENLLAQYQRKTQSISADDAHHHHHHNSNSSKLKPPKLMLRSSLTGEGEHPVSFGTSSPRFEGVVYHTEAYVKTSGMILGPDYDKKMEERYRLGPKFTKGPARIDENAKKDVVFEGPDAMRFTSLTAEVERSPIKYSAAFRPPSPKISLKDRLRRSLSPPPRHQQNYDQSQTEGDEDGVPAFGASHTISGTLDAYGNLVKDHKKTSHDDDDDDFIVGDGTHLGPGAFFPKCAPPSIEIRNPNKPSIPFMRPKSTKSRLAHEQEAIEKAKLAAIEEERIAMENLMHEKRLMRERSRNNSLLPLVRKRK